MKKYSIFMTLLLILFVSFGYAQTITVTSPGAGDTWYKGGTYMITWTHTGSMNSKVKIRLYQGHTKILGITDSTDNNGSFVWNIPMNLAAGTYYIRVKTVDNQVFDDGQLFTIAEPQITIKSPKEGNIWYKGTTYTIRWNHRGNMNANVKLRLYQGNNKILEITNSTDNDGSYKWTIPSTLPVGVYKIRVKTVDNKVYDDSEDFSIENPLPLTITSPLPGDVKTFPYLTVKWELGSDVNKPGAIILMEANRDREVLWLKSINISDEQANCPLSSSIADGSYRIKVKTNDNSIMGISGIFKLRKYNVNKRFYIDVPRSDVTFYINSENTITWSNFGYHSPYVDIYLYDKSGQRKILDIAKNVQNLEGHPGQNHYNWIIPNSVPEGRYTIRIKTTDEIVSANSEVFSILKPAGSIKVLSPKAGDIFYKRRANTQTYSGSPIEIRWETTGNIPEVAISLHKADKQRTFQCNITSFIPNRGYLKWPIPHSVPRGSYIIRIIGSTSGSGESAVFLIRNPGEAYIRKTKR